MEHGRHWLLLRQRCRREFATLKKELVHRRRYRDLADVRLDLEEALRELEQPEATVGAPVPIPEPIESAEPEESESSTEDESNEEETEMSSSSRSHCSGDINGLLGKGRTCILSKEQSFHPNNVFGNN